MKKPLIKYFKDGEWHYATVKDIGDLDMLNTFEKETIVDAINSIVINGNLTNENMVKAVKSLEDKIKIVDGNLDAHISNRSNPHGVTTEQVGTYSKTVIDNKDGSILTQAKTYIDNIKASLTELINNLKDNTYTKTEVDAKDSSVLSQAKKYVDSVKEIIEQLIANAKTEIGNNTYTREEIDTKDTTALNTSKAYTDSKVTSAKKELNDTIYREKENIIAGNVYSSTKLQTPRRINGVEFDGTKDINLSANSLNAYTKAETDTKINNSTKTVKDNLDSHTSNVSNPHNVTASQVGTYTKLEIDSKDSSVLNSAKNYTYSQADINSKDSSTLSSAKSYADTKANAVQNNLNSHVGNRNNPHNVTAGQVGAYTKAEVDTKVSGAVSGVQGNINSHIANKSNPHGVTASQVGTYTKTEIDSKDSNILSQSKSYTDGKFTPLNNRINDTTIIARAGNGKQITSDPFFDDGTNGIVAYNNSNNGTVTITRENPSGGTQPTGHNYRLRIVHTGTASPYLGGFVRRTYSRNNAEFLVKFNALIPSGASLSFHNNLIGNASSIKWLTSNLGTGTWEEYSYYVKCGASGTFQDFGFTAINYSKTPTPSAPLTWYVSSFEIYDISSSQSETIESMQRNINSIRNDLTNHANNRSNPHSVTASQVGAYTKSETDKLINNAKSSITTSSIGTYTKSEIDTKDTNTLNSAKSYADGKATSVQNNLDGHTNNRSNPHGVTASQVGTYTKQEIDTKDSSTLSSAKSYADGKAGSVQTNLNNHTSNRSNPHGVTASQVGAYTKSETDTRDSSVLSSAKGYADGKANTVQNNLNAHTGNRSNPHGVTASQVGAYSKGETYSRAEVDSKISSGVGNIDVGGANLIDGTKEFKLSRYATSSYKGYWNGLKIRGYDNIANTQTLAEWEFANFKYNDVFTFSFWVKGNVNKFRCYFYGASGYVGARVIGSNMSTDYSSSFNDGYIRFTNNSISNSEWRKLWVTWKIAPSGGNLSVPKYILIRTDEATGGSLYICGAKFERGNIATDWCPSVNDMTTDDELNDLRNHVIFVGTEAQWKALGTTEQNKYILKAIVE